MAKLAADVTDVTDDLLVTNSDLFLKGTSKTSQLSVTSVQSVASNYSGLGGETL